jgi:hypothetical protein
MANVKINPRTFDFSLAEYEVAALVLAINNSRNLAVTSPAYRLGEELVKALGYQPTEDIY